MKIAQTFPIVLACAWMVGAQTGLAAEDETTKDLTSYIVDVTGGAVSAGAMVGLAKTAVQQVETSQDLVAALQPFAAGTAKAGFGLAITPARSILIPMSGRMYRSSIPMTLLGNLTLSYAQNNQDISKINYQKIGYSLSTSLYFNSNDDPSVVADSGYESCASAEFKQAEKAKEDLAAQLANGQISKDAYDSGLVAASGKLNTEYKKCVDDAIKKARQTRWNAGRMSVSLGSGTIRPDAGGASSSLGRMLTVNAQFRAGQNGALYTSARTVRGAVDSATLATSPTYKNSSLLAARFTYGSEGTSPMRALIEVSNAKATTPSAFQGIFKTAVGIDYKIRDGIWLEFRLGRNHADVNGSMQTTGLVHLNISPTAMLFSSK